MSVAAGGPLMASWLARDRALHLCRPVGGGSVCLLLLFFLELELVIRCVWREQENFPFLFDSFRFLSAARLPLICSVGSASSTCSRTRPLTSPQHLHSLSATDAAMSDDHAALAADAALPQPSSPSWRSGLRLPRGVLPLRYDLALAPDLDRHTFQGQVRIQLRVDQPTHDIVMHSFELTYPNGEDGAPDVQLYEAAAAGGAEE